MLRRGADAEGMRGKRQRAADAAVADEPLPPVDPSLMTERQQLAFLLRTTAQEASASESAHSEEDASDGGRRAAAPARKKTRRPAPAREGGARGRPAGRRGGPRASSHRPARAKAALEAFPELDGTHEAAGENDASAGNAAGERARSRAEVSLRAAAAACRPEDAFGGWTCALCGGAPAGDALFLCPACDRKYPTQQALGRMCMT